MKNQDQDISMSKIAAVVYLLWGVVFLLLVFCPFIQGIDWPGERCCPWMLCVKRKKKPKSFSKTGIKYTSYIETNGRNRPTNKIGPEYRIEPPPPTWGSV